LNSENACYHSVQNPVSSRVLSRNIIIIIIIRLALQSCVDSCLPRTPPRIVSILVMRSTDIPRLIVGLHNSGCFLRKGSLAPRSTPARSSRVSLFVCAVTFDLYCTRNPTSSYATASMSPRII